MRYVSGMEDVFDQMKGCIPYMHIWIWMEWAIGGKGSRDIEKDGQTHGKVFGSAALLLEWKNLCEIWIEQSWCWCVFVKRKIECSEESLTHLLQFAVCLTVTIPLKADIDECVMWVSVCVRADDHDDSGAKMFKSTFVRVWMRACMRSLHTIWFPACKN